jgi:hypothetical protein
VQHTCAQRVALPGRAVEELKQVVNGRRLDGADGVAPMLPPRLRATVTPIVPMGAPGEADAFALPTRRVTGTMARVDAQSEDEASRVARHEVMTCLEADDALGALERTVGDLLRRGMSRHQVWEVLWSVYGENPAVIDPVITELQLGAYG